MRKILSLILSVCMVFSMLSTMGVTAGAEEYGGVWEQWVGQDYCESVIWSYDATSKTLTLSGEKISLSDYTYLPEDVESCFLECETLILQDFTDDSIYSEAIEKIFPNLRQLHFSETCTTEFYQFRDASTLEAITVDDNHPLYVSIDGVLYYHNMYCVKYPNGKKDTEYTVPDNVTYFGADAPHLEVLNVPEGMEEVDIYSGYGIINVYSMDAIPYGRAYGYKGSRAHEHAIFETDEFGYTYFREFNNALDKNGTYGDNITWSFDNVEKTLTISGDGPIEGADSKTGGRPAWGIFCWDTECIYIESGITEIGMDTINHMQEAKVIYIPKSVESINSYFYSDNLTDIYYEGSKSEWNNIEMGIYVSDSFDDVTIHYNHEMNPTKDFEDISFVSTIFAYDGEEKTIEIEGELPEGATVTYTNNTATDAGTYRATAVIEAEGYNTLTLNANLVINKAELTVKADDVSMIKGGEMPELTYTVEGELFGDDLITGELATKANGSKTGKFDITKGTLTAGDNYVIDFEKGTLTVGDKLEQDVVVGEINEKTYGDEAFVIEVTKDEESGLDNFTFESSNANVAEVDEDGTVTIKAAGTTKITVTQSGNETYAAFEKTLTLTVNKAALTVKADDVSMIKGGEMPELTYTVEGELFGDDVITGELATKANGSKTGKFDITKGTLTAGDNYVIDFEKGTLTVFDKTPQDVVVGEISEKTYGDEAFVIEVTKDEESGLDNFTFESSNTNVAEVDEDGTVTIKAAGTTKITVNQPGNETYAAFEKTLTLTVNKAALTVKADDVFMIKGGEMPELTYTVEGELFGDDVITGELATKANGNKTGKFDITQGTIKANSNYKLTFEKGTLTVSDKKMQNVVVGEIGEKTYGDEAFVIEVTKDEESGLDNFTFESSNTAVAEVSEDGTVVIKTAGETTITVTQPGNETYAAFEKTLTLRVKKRTVRVESVDLNNKTAVLSGLAEGDEVEVDLENIELEAEATENDVIEAVVKNFALLGTDAENYVLETESVTSEVSKENVVWVNVSAEMGTIEGEGIYLKGNKATVTAKPLSKYTFTGWYVGEELVSKNTTYTFDATEDVSLVAQFKKKSSGGGGGSSVSYYTVKFDTNGGNDIDKQSVVKNNKATMPAEPKKEGYIFKGWFADEKLTVVYDFETKVTKNVTLYAAWEEIDNSANEIVLTIDDRTAVVFGEKVNNDVAPIIRNDRTMLPARFVAEKLGATVEWNNDERKVIVTKGEVEIIIIIDSDIAYVNGKAVTLDSKAFIENDRTYTPVRFVAESLGAKVEWNNTNRKVTITK